MKRKIKLPSGPCAFCKKILRIQKLWCNIECQLNWETQLTLKPAQNALQIRLERVN